MGYLLLFPVRALFVHRALQNGFLDPILQNLIESTNLVAADCGLRQGAGGTEFAHFGSRACFLR